MRRSNQRPVTVTDIRAGSNGVGKSSVATVVVDGQITKARTAQHGLTAGSTEQTGNNGDRQSARSRKILLHILHEHICAY